MANLIADSANFTRDIRKSTEKGFINTIRNYFALITRKRELLLDIVCLVLIFIFIQSRISFVLAEKSPELAVLSVMFFSSFALLPMYSIGQWYFYWNVRLGWCDNVRFVNKEDQCFFLTLDLTLHYLVWNSPGLWFESGTGYVELHSEVALSNGPERFCQGRYEVISPDSGTLTFPGTPPIPYEAGKQSSILLRTTLDDFGCLRFVYIDANCNWRLPARHRISLRQDDPDGQ